MSGQHLTFFVPGVLLSELDKEGLEQALEYPHLPAMQCLLSRARKEVSPSLEHDLFRLFGLDYSASEDIPIAAATRHHDMASTQGGWCMRADPVHVQAGIDSLIMFGNQSLAISTQEATQLTDELNKHFSTDGWQLDALHTHRWYLQIPHPPELRTWPLRQVTGRSIQPFLPAGRDAVKWRGYLNEIQMVLHASAVNQAREERGEPLINSVWFWGGGELCGDISCSLHGVWSDDVLTDGLAIAADVPSFPVTDTFDAWLQQASAEGQYLISIQLAEQALVSGEYPRWREVLENIETAWAKPLLSALKSGELASITCYPGNGFSYRAGRRDMRRWWKPCRSLSALDA